MKKVFRLLAVSLLGFSAYAQGTILLNNRTASGDYPITIPDVDDHGPGAVPLGARAQLFLISGGNLVPLYPATTFCKSPIEETFFVEPVEVVVPDHPAGSTVTVQLRAWLGDDDQPTCCWWGELTELTVVLGGIIAEWRNASSRDPRWNEIL